MFLQVRREYALPPPEGRHLPNQFVEAWVCCEGWTILDFLEQMNFGDGAEDVANLFESQPERLTTVGPLFSPSLSLPPSLPPKGSGRTLFRCRLATYGGSRSRAEQRRCLPGASTGSHGLAKDITAEQQRRLDKYITLYNHGLPPSSQALRVQNSLYRFVARPLATGIRR